MSNSLFITSYILIGFLYTSYSLISFLVEKAKESKRLIAKAQHQKDAKLHTLMQIQAAVVQGRSDAHRLALDFGLLDLGVNTLEKAEENLRLEYQNSVEAAKALPRLDSSGNLWQLGYWFLCWPMSLAWDLTVLLEARCRKAYAYVAASIWSFLIERL